MLPESGPVRACTRCKLPHARQDSVHCAVDGSPLTEFGVDPWVGAQFDRFEIEAVLGAGGMARVYRARHRFLDEQVAIKIVYGEIIAENHLMTRFRREALASSKVKHPNVLSVRDFGATSDGLWFMTMDLVHGEPLSALLTREGSITPFDAAKLGIQICSGLAAAHELGFVHRDLKPSNLMLEGPEHLGPQRLLKLLDFGLVRRLHAPPETVQLTRSGDLFGTPSYMAPEQILTAAVEPRTDLYALGATLYEMVAGQPPFRGTLAQVLLKHLNDPIPPLPGMGGLEAIISRLLAKRPEGRPASAREVIDALTIIAERAPRTRAPAVLGADVTVPDPPPSNVPGLSTGLEDTAPSATAMALPDVQATMFETIVPLVVRKKPPEVDRTEPLRAPPPWSAGEAPPRAAAAPTVGYDEPKHLPDVVVSTTKEPAPDRKWGRPVVVTGLLALGVALGIWLLLHR